MEEITVTLTEREAGRLLEYIEYIPDDDPDFRDDAESAREKIQKALSENKKGRSPLQEEYPALNKKYHKYNNTSLVGITTTNALKLNELINTAEKIAIDEIKGHKGIRVFTILENAKGILEKEKIPV